MKSVFAVGDGGAERRTLKRSVAMRRVKRPTSASNPFGVLDLGSKKHTRPTRTWPPRATALPQRQMPFARSRVTAANWSPTV